MSEPYSAADGLVRVHPGRAPSRAGAVNPVDAVLDAAGNALAGSPVGAGQPAFATSIERITHFFAGLPASTNPPAAAAAAAAAADQRTEGSPT